MADVRGAGGKLVPGRANSPSVNGWYPINGRVTGTWSLNANTASPTTKAYLQIYLAELVPHVGTEAVAAAGARLGQIPSMAGKIADARAADWRKWPSVYLPDIADDPASVEALLDAIRALTLRSHTDS